ncbi:hypothetical protein YC2023_062167 [Brassica napus]
MHVTTDTMIKTEHIDIITCSNTLMVLTRSKHLSVNHNVSRQHRITPFNLHTPRSYTRVFYANTCLVLKPTKAHYKCLDGLDNNTQFIHSNKHLQKKL